MRVVLRMNGSDWKEGLGKLSSIRIALCLVRFYACDIRLCDGRFYLQALRMEKAKKDCIIKCMDGARALQGDGSGGSCLYT